MQDFGTKADNSPPPGGQLSAVEFNNLATENENAVSRSGQTLSGASDTQLAESLFLHSVKSESFQDSGAANAYVATPVSGASGVLLPASYTNMGGAVISFKASAANTGASTLNIGQTTGTLLGSKPIRTQTDTAIPAGSISASRQVQVVYNPAFDSGNGAWELLPWAFSSIESPPDSINVKMSVPTASATATLTADSIIVSTAIGGSSYLLPAFSKTINISTTGAGGMDTGSPPVSGWIAIYAIYNPLTGVSALLATNATVSVAPVIYAGGNMPAGFTASKLVSVWRITGASVLYGGFQIDNQVIFLGLGVLSVTVTQASMTSFSISTGAPPNAKTVVGSVNVQATAASVLGCGISPSSTSFGSQSGQMAASNAAQILNQFNVPIITSQTLFYTFTVTGGSSPMLNVSVTGYTF